MHLIDSHSQLALRDSIVARSYLVRNMMFNKRVRALYYRDQKIYSCLLDVEMIEVLNMLEFENLCIAISVNILFNINLLITIK